MSNEEIRGKDHAPGNASPDERFSQISLPPCANFQPEENPETTQGGRQDDENGEEPQSLLECHVFDVGKPPGTSTKDGLSEMKSRQVQSNRDGAEKDQMSRDPFVDGAI